MSRTNERNTHFYFLVRWGAGSPYWYLATSVHGNTTLVQDMLYADRYDSFADATVAVAEDEKTRILAHTYCIIPIKRRQLLLEVD